MMKWRILVLICSWCMSFGVMAGDKSASVVFDAITPGALAKVVLGDLAGVSYVLDPEVMADSSGFTIKSDGLTKAGAVEWLAAILTTRGYEIRTDKRGSVRVMKMKSVTPGYEVGEDQVMYRPKYRSMAYIVDLAKGFFPSGRWSFERAVTPASTVSAPPPGASEKPPASAGAVGNAFSRTDLDLFVYEGTKADCKRLRAFLAEIDTKPSQVLVQAALYEVSKISRDSSAVGIAAEILGGRLGITLGGGAITQPWSASVAVGGIRAVFSALASDTRFKSLARPEIRLANGAQGRVSVGDETPVLGAVTTQAGGVATQSIEYRPSGHILSVTPTILEEGVELQINQQSSSFVQTTTGVNVSPTLLKREVSTRVMVEPGAFVVLGGLQETRNGADVAGPRWFPDWLKKRGDDSNETELILVLHVEKV